MLAGDFLRLLRKLCIEPNRIGIYASPYERDEGNRAQIYWRDRAICAVEKGEVPEHSIYVDGDPNKPLIARGVKDTLEIVAGKGALKKDWRRLARRIAGGGYGF